MPKEFLDFEIASITLSSLRVSILVMTKNSSIGFFNSSALSATDLYLTVPVLVILFPMTLQVSVENFLISLSQFNLREFTPQIMRQWSRRPLLFKVSASQMISLVFPSPQPSSRRNFLCSSP